MGKNKASVILDIITAVLYRPQFLWLDSHVYTLGTCTNVTLTANLLAQDMEHMAGAVFLRCNHRSLVIVCWRAEVARGHDCTMPACLSQGYPATVQLAAKLILILLFLH